MRILITNDDGIEAPGLRALEHIAGEVSKDVWIVAPETNNSGASHSLTLAEPLRMRKLSERHYAVKETPTDCVIMGVRFLMKDQPPDLIMCGVNQGQNLADDVSYSGTVAGAIEGALLGIPSIAMSLVVGSTEIDQGGGKPKWETPMQHRASLVRRLMQAGWPKGVLLNVNFPDCEPDAVRVLRRPFRVNAILICCESMTVLILAAERTTGWEYSGGTLSRQKALTFGRSAPT